MNVARQQLAIARIQQVAGFSVVAFQQFAVFVFCLLQFALCHQCPCQCPAYSHVVFIVKRQFVEQRQCLVIIFGFGQCNGIKQRCLLIVRVQVVQFFKIFGSVVVFIHGEIYFAQHFQYLAVVRL